MSLLDHNILFDSDLIMPKTETTLTPRQIVEQLDQHIVGQANAKRAVAIAIRTAGDANS